MIKRIISVVTLFALVLVAAGLGSAPVAARPAAADGGSPNAKLLPADTALYVDVRTADLDKTINFVLDTVQKVTGFRPGDPYPQFDQGLTQFLGRPATFQKDVLSWLGDHVTVGLPISDTQLDSLNGNPNMMAQVFSQPNFLAIVAVKDDAAAKAFLTEVIDKSKTTTKMTFSTRTEDVGGTPVTIFDQGGQCGTTCGSVALPKGYIIGGMTSAVNNWLASAKAKKPGLADDANYTKLMGALQPDNLLTVYISPRFYQVQMASMEAMLQMSSASGGGLLATPQAAGTPASGGPMPFLRAALAAIRGQAFAARMDGKVLSLNVAQSIDLDAAGKLAQQMGMPADMLKGANQAIDGKLANQIPNKALAAVIASGIPRLYQGIKAAAGMMIQMRNQFGGARTPGFDPAQLQVGLQRFEAALKLLFNLDVQQDILSWMNGEFALYMTYNPTGTLSKMPNGSSWPFDHALLIQTSDAAKTKNFLTKLNAGLQKNAKGTTIKSVGDNVFDLTTGDGIELGYGLVGDTFFLSTGSGLNAATAAIKGDGTLAGSAEWQRALGTMVKPTSQIWFVNFTQITPLIKAMAELQGGNNPSTTQGLAALDLLESASISGGVMTPDGLSLASLQIRLK